MRPNCRVVFHHDSPQTTPAGIALCVFHHALHTCFLLPVVIQFSKIFNIKTQSIASLHPDIYRKLKI